MSASSALSTSPAARSCSICCTVRPVVRARTRAARSDPPFRDLQHTPLLFNGITALRIPRGCVVHDARACYKQSRVARAKRDDSRGTHSCKPERDDLRRHQTQRVVDRSTCIRIAAATRNPNEHAGQHRAFGLIRVVTADRSIEPEDIPQHVGVNISQNIEHMHLAEIEGGQIAIHRERGCTFRAARVDYAPAELPTSGFVP